MSRGTYIIFLTAAILTSCHKDKLETEGCAPVYMSASVQADPLTRAPYYATTPSAESPLEAAIWASTTSRNYQDNSSDGRTDGTVATHVSARFQGGSDQLISGIYYKADAVKDVYFVAMHPAEAWSINNDNNAASFTFNGSQDVMFAPETSGRYQEKRPTLSFKHLLTQIKVTIQAENENIADAWGKITKMSLKEASAGTIRSNVTIDLSSGFDQNKATFGSPLEELNFYQTDTDQIFPGEDGYTLKTTSEEVAYILCAPVDALDDDPYAEGTLIPEYTIEITSVYRTISIPLDLRTAETTYFSGSTMGKQFNVTLNFKMGNTIAVSAMVTDWQTGGIGIGKIEE